jgi:hypothetical protein
LVMVRVTCFTPHVFSLWEIFLMTDMFAAYIQPLSSRVYHDDPEAASNIWWKDIVRDVRGIPKGVSSASHIHRTLFHFSFECSHPMSSPPAQRLASRSPPCPSNLRGIYPG